MIRHPQGDLIWDTGLPSSIHDEPDGIRSGVYHITVPTPLVDQLAQLDLTPADIDFFSLSHSHFDHVGNAAVFANAGASATWIVDADEREWMFRDDVRQTEDFAQVAPLESVRTTVIDGDDEYDVFGDGTVTIIQAPGHTPGHCVLLVRLPETGPVLLAGDLWHLDGSRERRTVPRFNTDRAQTLASMDAIEALARQVHARVIRQHVPADIAALPAFPAPLK